MKQSDFLQKINSWESFLLANDGEYLWKLTLNQYDTNSIYNKYWFFGSKYGTNSIWNKYSNYWSPYSSLSPFNKYTSTPPLIFLRGQQVWHLTKNKYLWNSLDPDNLLEWLDKSNLKY